MSLRCEIVDLFILIFHFRILLRLCKILHSYAYQVNSTCAHHEGVWGCGFILALILTANTRLGMSGQLHAAIFVRLVKRPQCPLYKKLGGGRGGQSQSARLGEKRNLLPLSGVEPLPAPCSLRCLGSLCLQWLSKRQL